MKKELSVFKDRLVIKNRLKDMKILFLIQRLIFNILHYPDVKICYSNMLLTYVIKICYSFLMSSVLPLNSNYIDF